LKRLFYLTRSFLSSPHETNRGLTVVGATLTHAIGMPGAGHISLVVMGVMVHSKYCGALG